MNNFSTLLIFLFTTYFGFCQNHEAKIDSIVSSNYGQKEPGITILVAKDGKTIYKKAFGKSNLELDTPMSPNNVFQIGSITKQFTAISILILEEQGKLNIKDKISKYIPEYSEAGKNITIQHLLNHTSGIKNRTPVGGNNFISRTDMSSTELIKYFKNEPLDFKPGDNFKYSNSGYILLGRIIEIVSGQSYKDFIENTIFNKIGMSSSYYGTMKDIIKRRVSGYQMEQNIFFNSDYMSLTLPYSAGSILSTVDDLLKWQNALNTNILLKRSSFDNAIKPTILNSGKKIPYGYGFRLSKLENSPVIAHTGSTKGFTSIALYLPKEKIYIVALTNCNCKNINNVAKQVAELFITKLTSIDKTSQLEKKAIVVPLEILKNYVGVYEVRSNTNLTIGLDKTNNLYLLAPGQTKRIRLFAEKQNHFFVKVSKAKISFNVDKNNKTISLTMYQSGREITAKKK